jgi:hypothetical protein
VSQAWGMLAEERSLTWDEVFAGLRSGFTTELASNELIAFVLGGCVLVALLALGLPYLTRRRKAKVERPDYLVLACRVLGLSHAERALVRRMAAKAHLSEPAAMLLSPANLAYALERSSSGGEPDARERVDALCIKLFSRPLTAASASGDEPR